jgi:MFS family permease
MEEIMNTGNGMKSVIKNRNFKLLWLGQGASLLGDQFSLIAAPWLVLKLSNDPLALGAVLALTGIPRAVFMLAGGAITDRYSPRAIMLISDILRLALTALMAVLIFSGNINLGMVYVFALLFGAVAGFFTPASSAVVPQIVPQRDLPAGNSLTMGMLQLTQFIGPAIAGGIIAFFAHSASGTAPDLFGIGLAFSFDALTFLASVITLWLMDRQPKDQAAASGASFQDVLQSIGAGIRFASGDPSLRILFIIMLIVNFLFIGPLFVGIPVLANDHLAEGAVAFGLIFSAYGGGNLAGIILAGSLPRPGANRLRALLIGLIVGFGHTMKVLAFTTSTAFAFAMMLLMGIGNGYLAITLISMLQQMTPREMLGRIMSLVMLASMGLAPLSQALTGFVIRYSLPALFIGSGILMILTAGWLALRGKQSHLTFGPALD